MINTMKMAISLVVAIYCLEFVNGISSLYTWTQLDFWYPNPQNKQNDKANGVFIPENCVPMDVDVQYPKNKLKPVRMVFITIPRFRRGVPATLGTIIERNRTVTKNPLIIPFPRWKWHQDPELCKNKRLVSVVRIQIDQCGRIWVLDSGRIKGKTICHPQILVFQLENSKLLRKYEIPREQYEDHSIFVTIAVEFLNSKGHCSKKPFAYIADSRGNSLIVYDYQENRSWKIKHKSFKPIVAHQSIVLKGEPFYFKEGLTGLAIEPPGKSKTHLYYYPLASNEQSRVQTKFLKNRTRFINNDLTSEIFETFPNKINVRRSAAAFNLKGNILYFCSVTDSSIKYWKTKYGFNSNYIFTMDQDSNRLQYPSGLKIVKNTKGREELYVLSNRLQTFLKRSLSSEAVNFRILYDPDL